MRGPDREGEFVPGAKVDLRRSFANGAKLSSLKIIVLASLLVVPKSKDVDFHEIGFLLNYFWPCTRAAAAMYSVPWYLAVLGRAATQRELALCNCATMSACPSQGQWRRYSRYVPAKIPNNFTNGRY